MRPIAKPLATSGNPCLKAISLTFLAIELFPGCSLISIPLQMEPLQDQRGNLGAGYMLNENARRFCAEARQILLKDKDERHKRNMAKAIAEGFSSLEEKRQHSMNEFERAEEKHEKWMKAQAVLAGTTFEEFEGEHWAPQQFVPRYIGPILPDCACDGGLPRSNKL